ncbi:MAG: (2Fe-2S) ferredoxin domain-containing protein [Phormidesmis sp.]
MADSNLIRFRCLGRFVSFVPGKKSPYKKILLKAVQFDDASGEVIDNVEIKLAKSLRKKMRGYLESGDWVKVVGKGKAASRSEKIKWKASKVVRRSPSQAKKQQAEFAYKIAAGALENGSKNGNENGKVSTDLKQTKKQLKKLSKKKKEKVSAQTSVQTKPNLTKVLICQKGSCRKKGSLKVAQSVESELAAAGCLENVTIKATGCMGHCKAGPNLVMLPAKDSYKRVTPKRARSLIQKALSKSTVGS